MVRRPSYSLTDRIQRVTVLGVNSKYLPVLSGVPKGSILGPLLFLIYVNDLPDVASSTSVALFADDRKCYRSIESMEDGACLQQDFDHINQWCDLWQMELNQFKRGLLSITTNASSFHFRYQLSDIQVKTMETQKDLGVLVTKHLKWNSQVLATCSKANIKGCLLCPEISFRHS